VKPDEIMRYRTKAATCAAAWQQTLGEAPTRHALILAMAVADLETGLGNIRGHNWGSVHKRTLTDVEASVLLGHGIYPTGNDALAAARGLLASTQAADELLVIDASPIGPYFVWIWSFTSDLDAAGKFLSILIGNRASVRAIIDTATPASLSSAMYATRYYEGTSKNPADNVRAYGRRIEACAVRIETALTGWPDGSAGGGAGGAPPGAPPGSPPAPEQKRAGLGWWIAGIAALGFGVVLLGGRRT
jgi:hypothetical protein